MKFEQVLSIILACASFSVGIFFGALRAKLMTSNTENKFHYVIYGFCGAVVLTVIIAYFSQFENLTHPFHWYGNIICLLALGFAITLFFFTKKYLVTKSIYSVSELGPIINNFTKMADRSEIKLFGGDLNFFGNTPSEMDNNHQYSFLKSQNFTKVSILCEEPNDPITKIRYGKLYNEINNLELRFYHPEESDLRVRGRIIKINGSSKLLMYTKHSQGRYRALQTDTANSSGALYNNIWDLAWSMSVQSTQEQKNGYIKNYKENK